MIRNVLENIFNFVVSILNINKLKIKSLKKLIYRIFNILFSFNVKKGFFLNISEMFVNFRAYIFTYNFLKLMIQVIIKILNEC